MKRKNRHTPQPILAWMACVLLLAACGPAADSPAPDGPGPLTIKDVSASRFLHMGKIVVSWKSLDNSLLDTYVVYRFKGNDPVFEKKWATQDATFEDAASEDNPLAENTPYRYMVAWKSTESEVEYGMDGEQVWGFHGPYIDNYEPNDYPGQLAGGGSPSLDGKIPAVSYYYKAGTRAAWDDDFYRYSVMADGNFTGSVFVTVNFAGGTGSPFLGPAGDRLSMTFYYKGTFMPGQLINQDGQEFLFKDFGQVEPGTEVDLYFRIRPEVLSGAQMLSGAYFITVSTELK
jgi:hypothetical protein